MINSSPSRAMLLFGTEEPVEPLRRLTAGPLSADLDRGNLRYIRWGGREVVRAVSFVVRDTRWGTYSPEITDLVVVDGGDRFTVAYAGRCSSGDGTFTYRAEIEGRRDGTVAFRATGTTQSGFDTCRTGFVVLHPLEGVVGHAVEVEHASGARSSSVFPKSIAPDQPFFDVRALSHEPWPGTRVTVRMDGDTFEAEDHRNWTDASFKTYVRPLSWGYPYRIDAGKEISQAITVTIVGPPPPPVGIVPSVALRLAAAAAGPAPRFGLFLPDGIEVTRPVAEKIAAMRPSYVIGRIDLRIEDPRTKLAALDVIAAALDAPLGIEVVVPGISPQDELAPVADVVNARAKPLDSILVVPVRDLKGRPSNTVPEGQATIEQVFAAARKLLPRSPLGGGTTAAFPELNRNRPPHGIDFVTHATQAAIHAADDVSVMETLEALPDVILSTRAIVGNVAYRLGPATIGLPPSASGVGTIPGPFTRRTTLAENDPRQRGLFAAAFAIGLAAMAARKGIDAVTLAAPAGGSGLFDAASGVAYPVAAAFAGLAALAGAPLIETSVDGTTSIAAIAAELPDGPVLWLANLSAGAVVVSLGPRVFHWVRMIDAAALVQQPAESVSFLALADSAVTLDAYAICCLR